MFKEHELGARVGDEEGNLYVRPRRGRRIELRGPHAAPFPLQASIEAHAPLRPHPPFGLGKDHPFGVCGRPASALQSGHR